MCREGGGQGRGRGHQLLPSTSVCSHRHQRQAASVQGGLGGARLQPWTWPGAGVTLEPTQPVLLATGIPLLLQSAFLLCLTSSWLWHQEGSGGLGAPVCAGAVSVGCPGMGTRGTHWNVPGKGNLWDTSCSRGHSGGEGSAAWAANLSIISALSSCHLGSGSSGQWQAAAGSGLRAGEEAERDKESVSWPYTAPNALCLAPGLALPLLWHLRPRVLWVHFNL